MMRSTVIRILNIAGVLAAFTVLLAVFGSASAFADTQTYTGTCKVNGRTLTVQAQADAGVVPDGAQLTVKPIKGDDKEFTDVAKKVLAQQDADGILAYDISFVKDGQEVEPNGNVSVSMSWDEAETLGRTTDKPDVSLLHLKEDANGKVVKVDDLTDQDSTKIDTKTEDKTSTVSNVQFQTDSLSVFTIVWTKGDEDNPNLRIGYVNLHYVTDQGLEKDTSDELSAEDVARQAQKDGGIVKISDWAKDLKADDDGTKYSFDHAAIGSRNGTKITGVKVQQGKETVQVRTDVDSEGNAVYTPVEITNYKLYYTSDNDVSGNSKWTLYRDSASEESGNDANIFMVYTTAPSKPVKVHFMTLSGEPIKDADGKDIVKTVDGTSITDFVSWIPNNAPSGYAIKTTNSGSINSGNNYTYVILKNGESDANSDTQINDDVSGAFFRYLRYENGKLYAYRGNTRNYPGEITSDTADVYVTLEKTKAKLTVHYVDENGKKIKDPENKTFSNGDAFVAADNAPEIGGYSYESAHLDSAKGDAFTGITYTNGANGEWTSVAKNGDTELTSAPNPVNEVWLVYSKASASKEFTVHYQYQDTDGSYKNAVIYKGDSSTGNSTETKTVSSTDGTIKMIPLDPQNDSQKDSWIPDDVRKSDGKKLIYMSTRLGSADGPKVTGVSVNDDGTVIYHSNFGRRMSSPRNNQWTYTETTGQLKGRTFTLTSDNDGNLSLKDSQNGTVKLNYANDAGENNGATYSASYTGTLHGELTTSEYTVYSRYVTTGTSTTPTHYYDLEVNDSTPSTSTNVYQVYTEGDQSTDKLWIDDDIKYSGLYRTGISDSLANDLFGGKASDIKYEWHRVTQKGNEEPQDTVVSRKQSGDHFNIADANADRTWLDLEADEGSDTWSYGTKRSYYVKLTYKLNGVEQEPIESNRVTVNYYGRLENGSFENPTIQGNAKYSYKGDNNNAINGYFSNNPGADHYSDAFVWKTTQPGTGDNLNKDIEVVNTSSTQTGDSSWKHAYTWTSAGNWNSYRSDGADDGTQFAELNAEAAGALYQDVITHPNETLNYWFSHRARRDTTQGGAPKSETPYDSMYLVIMPTKLAMTLGDNSTELATQDELQKFIENHGGYDTDSATKEEDKITYRDDDNGILIRKVSSDDKDWHKIVATSGYTAKGGLTRFFFVAGKTASSRTDGRANTVGNFLDNVGFNQSLPPTDGFNITFTETFSGITMEQLAGLASNAKDVNGVTAQEHPLQLTVTNTQNSTSGSGTSQGDPNDALNGAKLGFTVSQNGNDYTITPTATASDGTTDLFGSSVSKPGSYSVKTNSDGSITISWIFPDQDLKRGDDDVHDAHFTYSVDDNVAQDAGNSYSTTDIAGYHKARTKNAVTDGTESSGGTGTAVSSTITQKTDATLNIINTYSPDAHISVRKTFSGVTPSTVREIMENKDNPYSITITKSDGSESKTLKASGNDSDVSVSSVTGTDGDTSYIWTIANSNWKDGTYKISESNYTTHRNELQKITLNGDKDISVESNGEKAWPSSAQEVTVDSGEQGSLSFRESSTVQQAANASYVNPGDNINLIVGQYGSGDSTRYVVWTDSEIGYATRNAIISRINGLVGWSNQTDATISNTSFFSGMNNGATAITIGNRSMQFDGTYLNLTGKDSDTWNQYYATHYNVRGNSRLEDDSEIRLTNEYAPKIKIQKQDDAEGSDGTHARLNKAVFRIYKKGGAANLQKLYYQDTDSTSPSEQWKSAGADGSKPKDFTTGNDTSSDNLGEGIAMLPTDLEQDGTTYYLEEYSAPYGYQKISDIPFKVKSNGTVVMLNANGDEISTSDTDQIQMKFVDPYYTFIINDKAGDSFPITGGKGIYMLVMLGLLMVLGASLGLILRRRKNLRSAK